jgi:DNA-directed RNA polymerase subunit alpha
MLQIQCLQSKTQEVNALFSRFAIGPLKKGQGLTVGNALRRILLSDLGGVSIAGVRISGVNHEFSTIPDIKEDVIDILLNLKQVVFKGQLNGSTLARLAYHGPGIITAKEIGLPEGITLVESNQYIASVNTNKTVEMEFLIKYGSGYSLNTGVNQVPEGFLAIDAVYMPVTKVNFFIETSGNDTSANMESLIFEVYTNGSITPMEAVGVASEILKNIFGSLTLTDSSLLSKPVIDEELKTEIEGNELENTLIEELELSVRAFNCLKRANIHTLPDLLKYSQEDLLEFKNFGQKSADEVCLNLQRKFGKTLN